MYAPFREALTAVESELLQTGHWNPADGFLHKLSEELSLQPYRQKDFINLISRICPGVVEFRVLRNPETREHKYLVKSLMNPRKKYRGYPLRSPVEIVEYEKYSRKVQVKLEDLPAHVGAMGNWKPLEISNMSAALRAGKGCIAAPSDFVLEENRHNLTNGNHQVSDEWKENAWYESENDG